MANLRYLLPVALVAGLLALPASASANSDVASVAFQGNATLLADPGPVNVTLHYSCPPPSPGLIQAEVIENDITGVSATQPATCDGQNHSVTLTVDGLFVPGSAEGVGVVVNGSTTSTLSGIAVAHQQIAIK